MNAQLASISLETVQNEAEVVNHMSLLTLVDEMPVQNYSLAKGLSAEEAAILALDYQLFIKDRTLHRSLITTKHKGTHHVYLVTDRSGTPVGVGMVVRRILYVYVSREYRRQGIGTLIVKAVKDRVQEIIGAPGIPGWDTFFKKNGVTCYKVV
jgi:GNAT superfamily N-acetyltransferase